MKVAVSWRGGEEEEEGSSRGRRYGWAAVVAWFCDECVKPVC